jgi:hypothetical protein
MIRERGRQHWLEAAAMAAPRGSELEDVGSSSMSISARHGSVATYASVIANK